MSEHADNRHENIISILDIVQPTSIDDFHEVYLVQVSCLVLHKLTSRNSWRQICE